MEDILKMVKEGQIDFFDPVDFERYKFEKLKKSELIEIIKLLNEQMIASLDNWEGG